MTYYGVLFGGEPHLPYLFHFGLAARVSFPAGATNTLRESGRVSERHMVRSYTHSLIADH